ncbi:class I adenylate-forming enzyme family protein [Loktanella salsilacus]|uniref:class I adenylate-forming enzyme family protein n=1 Tax=Loktanella salsilacus TaxID=195913 RepID=UPI0037350273
MNDTFRWHTGTRLTAAPAELIALAALVQSGTGLCAGRDGVTGHAGADLLCETSGSSGAPKVIRRTPASWQASFAVNGAAFGLGTQSCVAIFSGFGASLALYAALEAAHHGAAIISLAQVRPDRWAATVAAQGATVLYLTPVQLDLLCASGAPLPAVRHIVVGGGRLSVQTMATAFSACPNGNLVQFYGAAETSFITWTNAATPAGSVGKSYPEVTLRLDPEGVIWVRSPYLFHDYAQGGSDDTRWDDGFLSVGEVGHLDAAGNLFLLGRKNRMVTVSDHNVFPEAVEAFLTALLPMAQVAVVALPDPRRGARLVAVLSGDCPLPEADILRTCRQQLGPHAAPTRAHRVSAMPMLPAGKPDYPAITELAQSLK